MNISTELELLTKKSGLSYTEFAEKVKIDPAQLKRYRAGTVAPRRNAIEKIQKVYPDFLKQSNNSQEQVTVSDLFKFTNQTVDAKNEVIENKDEIIDLLKDKISILERTYTETIFKQIERLEENIGTSDERLHELKKIVEELHLKKSDT